MLGPLTPVIVLGSDLAPPHVDLSTWTPAEIFTTTVAATPLAYHEHQNHNNDSRVSSWDEYVGQEPMKRYVRTFIKDAMARGAALPHMLLATGMPGAGKTTFARAVAEELGVGIKELVPPFSVETLFEVAQQMNDYGVLFIDEIHLLASDSEHLLTLLEEGTLYIEDQVIDLADFTVIGASTDAGKLPPAVLSRFAIQPYFQAYSIDDLTDIAEGFARKLDVDLSDDTLLAIAKACQGIPRSVRDLVVAARALLNGEGSCTPEELLAFTEITEDGLNRVQVDYLTRMYTFFGREVDGHMVYSAGENTMASLLRQPTKNIPNIERYLVDCGFLNKTPRGRFLTETGARRAAQLAA